ncbi:hypothetical protein J6590_096802, partial [Homalodisca vitripennis]
MDDKILTCIDSNKLAKLSSNVGEEFHIHCIDCPFSVTLFSIKSLRRIEALTAACEADKGYKT